VQKRSRQPTSECSKEKLQPTVGPLKLKAGSTWLDALVQQPFPHNVEDNGVAVSARRETAIESKAKSPVANRDAKYGRNNIAVSFERAIGANGRIIDVEQPEELPGTTEFEFHHRRVAGC